MKKLPVFLALFLTSTSFAATATEVFSTKPYPMDGHMALSMSVHYEGKEIPNGEELIPLVVPVTDADKADGYAHAKKQLIWAKAQIRGYMVDMENISLLDQ